MKNGCYRRNNKGSIESMAVLAAVFMIVIAAGIVFAGGSESLGAVATIKDNRPTVSAFLPENGNTTTNQTVNFTFNVRDDLSSVVTCTLYVNSVANVSTGVTGANVTGGSNSSLITNLTDGTHNWYISCVDSCTTDSNPNFCIDGAGVNNTGVSTTRIITVTVTTGAINGFVKNATGSAISGATVQIKQGSSVIASSATDGTGYYAFSLNAGIYDVVASKAGYADATNSGVTVTAGQTTQSNLTLTAANGTLSGTVKDNSANNNGLYGASVQAKVGADVIGSATTPDGGAYSISLAPNTYDVLVSKAGFIDSTISKAVSSGQTTTHDVNLSAAASSGAINGTIYDNTFTPLSNVKVTVKKNAGGAIVQIIYTNSNGRYRVVGLPTTDTYDLVAEKAGFTTNTFATNVGVSAGGTVTRNAVLTP